MPSCEPPLSQNLLTSCSPSGAPTANRIFSLTTPSGNLIGSSQPAELGPAPATKKAHVLGALTWRHYRDALRAAAPHNGSSSTLNSGGTTTASHSTSVPGSDGLNGGADGGEGDAQGLDGDAPAAVARPLRIQPLAVLRLVRSSDGRLRTLAVEVGGRKCVLEQVREGLLVGALGPEKGKRDEGQQIEEGEKDREDGEDTSEGSNDGNEGSGDARNGQGDEQERTAQDEKETARRVRALMLKAAAMAEFLREELGEFKMPQELH